MKKTFRFHVNSQNGLKLVALLIPLQQGGVITNEFCPDSFLVGNSSMSFSITPINGESEPEFVMDCNSQIQYINQYNGFGNLNIHVSALKSVVSQHVNRCGRLIFNDLLIYVDVFAYFLYYAGYNRQDVVREYVKIVYEVIGLYRDSVKNPVNLAPLTQTPLYDCVVNEYNELV